MEDIRYKEISKIVGIYGKSLLKVSLEIQTNHIKMSLHKLIPSSLDDFITTFNTIDLKQKIKIVTGENIEELYLNIDEGTVRDFFVEYIKQSYKDFQEKKEWKETSELYANIDKYKGKSIPLTKWIGGFANEILDESIMEFIPSIVAKLKSIEERFDIVNNENLGDFVLYMGDFKKYRGCIGKIEKRREDNDAPTLVTFLGKGKREDIQGKLWCSDDNLLSLN